MPSHTVDMAIIMAMVMDIMATGITDTMGMVIAPITVTTAVSGRQGMYFWEY